MLRSELRYAIWVAHGKKDAYGEDFIEHFGDLEIDHIIPKSTNKLILKEKILKYNLGVDFTLDSIENLLPTSKLRNRQKSGIAFNESSERFYLAYALGKKKIVEEECKKTIRNRKLKEKVQFGKSYTIVDTGQSEFNPTYFHSDTLIALNALLPSQFNELGSCAIEFYEVGNMITLNHNLIMYLIGRNEECSLEEVVLQYYNEKSKTVFVIIGTSSLHLKKEAYDQLITILRDFLKVYREFLSRFKIFMGIGDFKKSESKEGYILTETTPLVWNFIISYSYQNDIDNSNNDSFCFNANRNRLIAIDPSNSIIKFTISPVFKQDSVALIWHLPHKNDRKFIGDDRVWTAEKTFKWLEEIITNFKGESEAIETKGSKPDKKSILYRIKKVFLKMT